MVTGVIPLFTPSTKTGAPAGMDLTERVPIPVPVDTGVGRGIGEWGVGVGVTAHGERISDENLEYPDEGIGEGLTHDGIYGVGVGVGRGVV
jgi:hypothetical protein